MPTFYEYDPIYRNLTASASSMDPDHYRSMLEKTGAHFVEWDEPLPGYLHECGVTEDGEIVVLEDLPESCRVADQSLTVPTEVPQMPDLPPGGVVSPEPGTVCGSGDTAVFVRAPLYKSWGFTFHVYTSDDAKRDLIAYAADKRWQLMQRGADWRGHKVSTDDTSQARMTSAIVATMIDPNWSTIWQFPIDGSSAPVTRVELIELASAAQAYVNALFVTFDSIKARVENGEITDEASVDLAFD